LGDYDATNNNTSSSNQNLTVGANGQYEDLPNDSTMTSLYCAYLVNTGIMPATISDLGVIPPDTISSLPQCQSQVGSQVNNDVGHFRQYLLDSDIMSNYTSLMSTN
jgi:hypothetical protein